MIYKFIKKSAFFVLFVYVSYTLNFFFLHKDVRKDLINVSLIYSSKNDEHTFSKQKKYYDDLANYKNKYDVINIGDSFSLQEELAYHNFLAKEGKTLLNLFTYSIENPAQILVQLINDGFFNQVSTNVVILESVERSFVSRLSNIDYTSTTKIDKLKRNFLKFEGEKNKQNDELKTSLFSKDIYKAPFLNFQYFLGLEKPIGSFGYKVKTNKSLFTEHDDLMFYADDINMLLFNSNDEKLNIVNQNLNKIADLLHKKGIKLIVLACPDKYDFYYDDILNKTKYQKPLFFDKMSKLDKKYIFINSKTILKKQLTNKKDVYHYYDSHWSPMAAEVIGKEIYKSIISL